jgi:putative ABC transport system permease protein
MATTTWMKDLADDIRFGVRTLRKNPAFTAVAVLTLALGIGANTAIFSVVENVLLRPLPYDHPESLVEVWNTYPNFPRVGLSPGDYFDWCRDAQSFSACGGYAEARTTGFNLTGVGEPERIQASFLSSDLLAVLGLRPVIGRTFLPEEDHLGSAPEALLSHRYWQRRFGANASIVGRTITLDDRKYTIIGVLPAAFQFNRGIDLWLPFRDYPDVLTSHVHHGLVAVGRLKPGVTLAQAQAEIDALNHQEDIAYPDSHKSWGTLVRLMEDPSAAKLRTTLLVLFGAVALVLLIACANIANLLLARNAARQREMALRTALGANRWRLARQLLTESTLLALGGGVVGVLLAAFCIGVLGALAPPALSAVGETTLNGRVLLFTVAVSAAAGIVCGLLPAIQSQISDLNGVLKQGGKGSGGPGSHRMHNALVVSEVALALVPLIGAGLLLRSLRELLAVAPGFQTEHVLTMQITQAALPLADLLKLSTDEQSQLGKKESIQFQQILDQVNALPGVKSAAGISTLPLQSLLLEASRFVIEGHPVYDAGSLPIAQIRTITPDYFATVGIPLLRGRTFTPHDWDTQNTVIVNETLARHFFAEEDPLGRRMNFCSLDPQPCWTTIVGIVGNVHQFGLDGAPTYDVYFSGGWTQRLVIRTASDPTALAAAAAEAVHRVDPMLPVTEVSTLEGLVSTSVSPRRFAAVLIGVLAGLALTLSAVGIYGVMSYTVGQRTQEIGIRVALGAQRRNLLALVLGRGMRLTLAGIAAGILGALALTRFLSSLLFGVQAQDPLTFAGVAALLMAVALLACYVPARRAMKVDPMVALRYE